MEGAEGKEAIESARGRRAEGGDGERSRTEGPAKGVQRDGGRAGWE